MVEIELNQSRAKEPTSAPTRAPMEFHRKLPGYQPTDLIDSPGISDVLGIDRLWIKVESERFDLPSFKILGASWAVCRALDQHVGGFSEWSSLAELQSMLEPHRPIVLSAATDGNHGRAVARMAALLGLDARIFVPMGTADARIDAIQSEGASCEIVDGTYDDAVRRSAANLGPNELVISDTSWPGYEDVPRWVVEGYSTIFWETHDQLIAGEHEAPDLIVVQMGVGALATAAAQHFRRRGLKTWPRMIGVEPTAAACVLASVRAGEIVSIPGPHNSIMAGLNCDTPSLIAWPHVSRSFDAFIAISDDVVPGTMRMFASEGIVAGETGAAGLAGLIQVLERGDFAERLGIGPSTRALVFATEGATDPEAYERLVGLPWDKVSGRA